MSSELVERHRYGGATRAKPLPSREYLLSILEDVGNTVRWRTRKSRAIKAGDRAKSLSNKGYLRVQIDGGTYFVHRVLFKMRTGMEPMFIDHVNGDRTDNSPENLRAANFRTNSQNRGVQANSSSGVKNVLRCRRSNKWYARVRGVGRSFYSPKYETIQEAEAAAREMRRHIHGEFSHD